MYRNSEKSKILWVVRNDRVSDALAICKSDSMDLSGLRGIAPVLAFRDLELLSGPQLPKSSIRSEALETIANMEELKATVQKPSALSPNTYLTCYIRTN